jgi:hypothetical protein
MKKIYGKKYHENLELCSLKNDPSAKVEIFFLKKHLILRPTQPDPIWSQIPPQAPRCITRPSPLSTAHRSSCFPSH